MKIKKIERRAISQMEDALNRAQKITKNYVDTANLPTDPEKILAMNDSKLMKICAILYLCYEVLATTPHEIEFTGIEWEVKITN